MAKFQLSRWFHEKIAEILKKISNIVHALSHKLTVQ